MFLHIGADIEILSKSLIAILNVSSIQESSITTDFLKISEEDGFIRRISEDQPKSAVIVDEDGQYYIYLSPINSTTLQNRLNLTYRRGSIIDQINE